VAPVDGDGQERGIESQPEDRGRALRPAPHEDEHRGRCQRGDDLEEQPVAQRAPADQRGVYGGDADPHRPVDAGPVRPDRADPLRERIVGELARRGGVGVRVVGHDDAPVGAVRPEVVRRAGRHDHRERHHDDDRTADEPTSEPRAPAFDDRHRPARDRRDHDERRAARPVSGRLRHEEDIGQHRDADHHDATDRHAGHALSREIRRRPHRRSIAARPGSGPTPVAPTRQSRRSARGMLGLCARDPERSLNSACAFEAGLTRLSCGTWELAHP